MIQKHSFSPQYRKPKIIYFPNIGLSDPQTGKVFTDLPGRFPFTRNRVMQYILILYAYASNAILVEPIKSRIDTDILLEYDTLYDTLETAEQAPKLNIMYNLASTALNILLQKRKTSVG